MKIKEEICKRKKVNANVEDKISFVVQGPYQEDETHGGTYSLLSDLKTQFPQSEILYSGWSEPKEKITGVKYIISEDPGDYRAEIKYLKNAKRLVKSTIAGISNATNDIVVKMRSDGCISPRLSKSISNDIKKIKNGKIGICHHSTPTKAFMLDDKIQIGLKGDMLKFWSPNFTFVENDYLTVLKNNINGARVLFEDEKYLATEQILFLSYCRPRLMLKSEFSIYYSYLKALRRHFIFLNAPRMGFSSSKWNYRDSYRLNLYLYLMNKGWINFTSFILRTLAYK